MSAQFDFMVGQPYFRDNGLPVDSNKLKVGQKFKMMLSLLADNFFSVIPAGGSLLKITLGKNLKVSTIDTATFKDIFDWKLLEEGTVIQATQKTELFKDFNVSLEFDLEATGPTVDEVIKVEWIIVDKSIVEDYQPLNNYSTLLYTVFAEAPVKEATVESTTTTTTKKPKRKYTKRKK